MPNNNFKKAIKDLIIDNGKNVVKKDRSIQGYIEDTLSSYPAQKNISINLAKEGILKELGNKSTLSETELKSYTNQIVGRYGTDSILTQETVRAWAEALGVGIPETKQKPQPQVSKRNPTTKKSLGSIKFPLAIKVNAWLILAYPVLIIAVLTLALFSNNDNYVDLMKNLIYDKSEPFLSWVINIENIMVFILIWIMYINKQLVKYIVTVFYLDCLFKILINLDVLRENFFVGGITILMTVLPVLWLYLSKDVENFIASVK